MRVQFRIRSLFILVVIVALAMTVGIQSARLRQAEVRAQRAAAEARSLRDTLAREHERAFVISHPTAGPANP